MSGKNKCGNIQRFGITRNTYYTERQVAWIEETARRRGISFSAVVRSAVNYFIAWQYLPEPPKEM